MTAADVKKSSTLLHKFVRRENSIANIGTNIEKQTMFSSVLSQPPHRDTASKVKTESSNIFPVDSEKIQCVERIPSRLLIKQTTNSATNQSVLDLYVRVEQSNNWNLRILARTNIKFQTNILIDHGELNDNLWTFSNITSL